MHLLTQILTEVDVPDVSPDFDAPWIDGVIVFISYLLATALILAVGALIVAVLALVWQGAFPDQVRTWAGKNILIVFVATIILSAISSIFQWLVNFDFGF